jgi:hypothetical protein
VPHNPMFAFCSVSGSRLFHVRELGEDESPHAFDRNPEVPTLCGHPVDYDENLPRIVAQAAFVGLSVDCCAACFKLTRERFLETAGGTNAT